MFSRKLSKVACTIGLSTILLQGCTTGMLISETKKSKEVSEQDSVRYVLSSTESNEGKYAKEIIILGEKYSYKVRSVEKERILDLEKIASIVDIKYFKPQPLTINFEYGYSSYTTFTFDYDKQNIPLTDTEKQILSKYCQQKTDTAHTNCTMHFDVQLYDKMTPPSNYAPVKGHYPIKIIHGYKTDVGKRVVLMPLAIAYDVATSPLQLLFSGLFFGLDFK